MNLCSSWHGANDAHHWNAMWLQIKRRASQRDRKQEVAVWQSRNLLALESKRLMAKLRLRLKLQQPAGGAVVKLL